MCEGVCVCVRALQKVLKIFTVKTPVLFYLSLVTSVATGKQLKTSRFPHSFLCKVSCRLGSTFIDTLF